eukprot:TRINITY_DN26644_c0_g1_i1.p1 TRINITY_DN26644_c0_g1~~TRINITY_DN26644_c0_g1_i1.p1  ORF type:complete len:348 (-),score=79.07 TRINITY_DN26644_c0_g1_i1:54-1097(-)
MRRANSSRWSFWNVPLQRRLQTAAVALVVFFIVLCVIANILCILVPVFWWFYLPYLVWVFIDRETGHNGGRIVPFVRRLRVWKYFRDYFPSQLLVVEPLDPSQTYVFGIHPHGIIGMSCWANLLNDASGVRSLLKGIDYRVVTLPINFNVPFFRDFVLSLGAIASSRRSIMSALSAKKSVIIVVGGAAEALMAYPGNESLVLGKRKGFVRLALETGSHLVPMYSFGENDLYDQVLKPHGSLVRRLQDWAKRKTGISFPLFHGRGIWNYDFGILPHRRKILTIVGRPIKVPKIENPSEDVVDQYHQRYIDELTDLFESHKSLADKHERTLRNLDGHPVSPRRQRPKSD